MLDIKFEDSFMNDLTDAFNSLGVDALYMNHYELEAATEFNANDWRKFLMNEEVSKYINAEVQILRDSEVKKLMKDVSNKKGQVGTAQLITALDKVGIKTQKKNDGPVFIYTYIPLNASEQQAENVVTLDKDPFLKGD